MNITAQEGNFKKVSDSFLKSYDLDAEQIKDEIFGDNSGKYDIYINKDNGDIYAGPKSLSPNTELQPTGFRVSNGELSEGFNMDLPSFDGEEMGPE
jgi:hypothetical protein